MDVQQVLLMRAARQRWAALEVINGWGTGCISCLDSVFRISVYVSIFSIYLHRLQLTNKESQDSLKSAKREREREAAVVIAIYLLLWLIRSFTITNNSSHVASNGNLVPFLSGPRRGKSRGPSHFSPSFNTLSPNLHSQPTISLFFPSVFLPVLWSAPYLNV